MHAKPPWRPPAPPLRSNLAVGLSLVLGRATDLLQTLPRDCYEKDVVVVPIGKRPVLIVNDPEIIKRVLIDDHVHFPKSDLMISTLAPLLGDGVLISNGTVWEHDRQMLAPGFDQLRVDQMFPLMQSAVSEFVDRLAGLVDGTEVDLEAQLSRVTADIMFRSMFSQPMNGTDAADVFAAFTRFQRNAPQFDLHVILRSDPDRPVELPEPLQRDAALLRGLIAQLLDQRLHAIASGKQFIDFTQSVIDARDGQGNSFSRERMIDQLAVFFLAGHETTASALSWTIYLLSQQPDVLADIRAEIDHVLGDAPFQIDDLKRLSLVRHVFREGLRLYPPAAFLTRRALREDRFGRYRVPVNSFVVVSPWLVHRHRAHWDRPDMFDPYRFESATPKVGTYIPFGLGPRVCTGAMIAQLEAALIMTEVLRRYDFTPVDPASVFPITRVTIRPGDGITCRVSGASSNCRV
jgi:cytochrome P450